MYTGRMHHRHHISTIVAAGMEVAQKQTLYSEYLHGLEALSQSMNHKKGVSMHRPVSVMLRLSIQSYIRPSMGCYLGRTAKDVPEGARISRVNL